MAACPPKSVYLHDCMDAAVRRPGGRAPKVGAFRRRRSSCRGSRRPHIRAALFLDTSFWQKKKYLARLLDIDYEAMKILVCETLYKNKKLQAKSRELTSTPDSPVRHSIKINKLLTMINQKMPPLRTCDQSNTNLLRDIQSHACYPGAG